MKRAMQYEAHDGTRFATAKECKTHEREYKLLGLTQLTEADIKSAIDRTNPELADAIEFAGNLITENRRAAGHLRRKGRRRSHEI